MPLPIIVAGAMAGLNLIGGLNQNDAIDKQATANWNANLMGLNQKRGVDVNNLTPLEALVILSEIKKKIN